MPKSHSLLRSAFDKEKREVPGRPDNTKNQARNQRVPFVLKAVEGETTPAEFFTEGTADNIGANKEHQGSGPRESLRRPSEWRKRTSEQVIRQQT